MARSEYIYVVTVNGALRRTFTVKKEMVSWLDRAGLEDYDLWRCRDGVYHDSEPELMTLP